MQPYYPIRKTDATVCGGMKMVEQTRTTKYLLNQLYTEEGRAHVIDALARNRHVPLEYIERRQALEQVLKQRASKSDETRRQRSIEPHNREALGIIGAYEEAGEQWGSVELSVKVIDAYYTVGRSDDAVATALQYGFVEKALQIREDEQNWSDAAAIAKVHEHYERAGRNYERAKQYGKAGDCFVAEAGKRKDARKRSSNIVVSLISYLTEIKTPKENDMLACALRNYLRARWDESAEETAAKITNKRMVFVVYEEEGKFAAAEQYAASQKDIQRQQLYRTIDCMMNPKRVAFETIQRELHASQRDLEEQLTSFGKNIASLNSKESRTKRGAAYRDIRQSYKKRKQDRNILQQGYDHIAWLCKEVTKAGLAEGSYFYLKKLAIIPAVLGLGIIGKCSYIDAQIPAVQQASSAYTTTSVYTTTGEQREQQSSMHGCGVQQ
jgi:hypothetical protein